MNTLPSASSFTSFANTIWALITGATVASLEETLITFMILGALDLIRRAAKGVPLLQAFAVVAQTLVFLWFAVEIVRDLAALQQLWRTGLP